MTCWSSLCGCCCIFSCCRRSGQELRALNLIASYGYLVNLLDRLFWLTDYAFLGYLGKGQLAAGILALCTINLGILFMEGFIDSQDSVNAMNKDRYGGQRRWAHSSLLIVLVLTAIMAVFLSIFSFVLYSALDLRAHVSVRAIAACWCLLPAFLLHGLQLCLHKLLNQQDLAFPTLLALFCGLLANAVGNFLFISVLQLGGAVGAAVATSAAKLCIVCIMAHFLKKQADYSTLTTELRDQLSSAWHTAQAQGIDEALRAYHGEGEAEMITLTMRSRKPASVQVDHSSSDEEAEDEGIDDEGLQAIPLLLEEGDSSSNSADGRAISSKSVLLLDALQQAAIGFPAAIMLCAFAWPYEISILMVASMGSVALCSHTLLLLIVQCVIWTLIHPLASAMALRVHSLLQARRLLDARYAVRIGILQGAGMACLFGGLVYLLSSYVGHIFTGNGDVVRRISKLAWFAALLLLALSLQVLAQGAMKALGYQLDCLTVIVVGVWLCGGGLGIYLAFFASVTMGLEGLWIGLITGSALAAIALIAQLLFMDWEHELRKHLVFTNAARGQQGGPMSSYYDIALNAVDSRGLGGFHLRTYRNLDEEIDEMVRLEEMEVVLNHTDP